MNGQWSFSASPPVTVFALAGWLVCVWLAVLQWRRRGGGGRLAMIEGTRVLAVTLVCLALFKPEIVQEIPHVEQPKVVILRDVSGSMATRDVRLPDGTVETRAQWLAANATPQRWQPIAAKGQLAVEDFGAPPPPDSNDEDGTDIGGALSRVLAHTENLKAVLLLSDGDWNLGQSPLGAATQYGARDIPIYTIGAGSETPLPDLILDHADVPAYGLLGDQITIPFRIRSHLAREVHSTLTLSDSTGHLAQKSVTIPAFAEIADSMVWMPSQAGDYNLDLHLPVEPDETIQDNNDQRFRIAVRTEKLKVLVVDSLPRWEYRYLRNALMRDPGVEVRTLLYQPGMQPGEGLGYIQKFPASKDELSQYDVIFLGDVGIGDGELTAEDIDGIRAVVEQQGSGLVLLPGPRGREDSLVGTKLNDLLPVDFDKAEPGGLGTEGESHIILTAEGKGHLLTLLAPDDATNAAIWRNLPGFYWCAAVSDTRPGAEVLAVHSTLRNDGGRIPLLVTRPFGNGKVLFMGTDGAWRWRLGVEDKYHYRFWGQVIRWMAHQRHLAEGQHIRLSFSPETPRTGDAVSLLATIFDDSGFPVTKGNVSARITTPSGASERLDMAQVPGGWGVFRADYTPRASGRLHIVVKNNAGGQTLETDLNVERSSREKVGEPANLAILRDISALTRGASGGTEDLDAILKKIALLPEPRPIEQRIHLWSEWYTAVALLTLFAAYWTARKLSGLT
ncbi:MAG TPA: hypothetical protein VHY22_05975 [Chthoniobacteraceae bacterium]|jgi:hypothetical protein|nr:hypothetical protein [Chthoniobacteraceae bacterium]